MIEQEIDVVSPVTDTKIISWCLDDPVARVTDDGVLILRQRLDGSPWPHGTEFYSSPFAGNVMHAIKPLRTTEDHAVALAEVEALMDATPGTPASDRLEVLAILVEAYEVTHFPFPGNATGGHAADDGWTNTPPTSQSEYWHWDGNGDHSPTIYHVLWSGSANKCFLSMGQHGIREATWYEAFGGWWKKIERPSLPSPQNHATPGGGGTIK